MRNITFFLVMLLMVSTAEASNTQISPINNRVYNNFNDVITFVERGIRFRVYLTGEFDFDNRRLGNRRFNNRVRIDRDYRGRIRRVGNVAIQYNFRGDIRRIGSIFIQYNRRGLLSRVGNLKIYYNRWGDPTFYGRVRYNDYHFNNYDNYIGGGIYGYYDPFFYRRDFRNYYSQFREDNNFFYYRAKTTNGNIKKGDVIKRRKPTTVQKKRTTTRTDRRR